MLTKSILLKYSFQYYRHCLLKELLFIDLVVLQRVLCDHNSSEDLPMLPQLSHSTRCERSPLLNESISPFLSPVCLVLLVSIEEEGVLISVAWAVCQDMSSHLCESDIYEVRWEYLSLKALSNYRDRDSLDVTKTLTHREYCLTMIVVWQIVEHYENVKVRALLSHGIDDCLQWKH
jgi:hypothetical protein